VRERERNRETLRERERERERERGKESDYSNDRFDDLTAAAAGESDFRSDGLRERLLSLRLRISDLAKVSSRH
jgi:hypothetical protein